MPTLPAGPPDSANILQINAAGEAGSEARQGTTRGARPIFRGYRAQRRDAATPTPAHLKTGSPQEGLGGSNPSPSVRY